MAERCDARAGPHRSVSTGRRIWTFSVATIGETSSLLPRTLSRYLSRRRPEPTDVVRLRDSAATVVDHRYFAGVVAPGDWPGLGRIAFRVMGGRYGDGRDWSDIDRWADSIGRECGDETEFGRHP